jgi:hypothetical protein
LIVFDNLDVFTGKPMIISNDLITEKPITISNDQLYEQLQTTIGMSSSLCTLYCVLLTAYINNKGLMMVYNIINK